MNLNPRNTSLGFDKKNDKKSTNSINLDTVKHEDYIFDYNGEKGIMSPNIFFKLTSSNTNKQMNNVLKTTYRVFDTINSIKEN